MNSKALLLLLAAVFARAELFEAVEPHMGTLVRIKLFAPDARSATTAFERAFGRIADLDAHLSDYKTDSELNRLCRDTPGRPHRVSADLFRVLEAAQLIAAQTDGAFDVTLGPVTRLWRAHRVPDAAALREALRHTGFRKVHLDAAHQTVLLDEPEMQLDLGGIAKGYAAGEALAVLTQLGIRSALVAISGDLAMGDAPPGEPGWKVEIGSSVRRLHHCAVSTSGPAEQHVDSDGVRYSHIIDPATGLGLTHSMTVTVIAPHGIHADALSTAISVVGAARGKLLLNAYPGAEMILH